MKDHIALIRISTVTAKKVSIPVMKTIDNFRQHAALSLSLLVSAS
jgi:hypothetical protein